MTERTTTDTVHSTVVRVVDCRSASFWFSFGRRFWFACMTWSSKLKSIEMFNNMGPITTSIRTIARKSVNKKREGEKRGGEREGEGGRERKKGEERGGGERGRREGEEKEGEEKGCEKRKGKKDGKRGKNDKEADIVATQSSTDWSTRSKTGATSLVKEHDQ